MRSKSSLHTYHDTLWEIRLRNDDRSKILQDLHNDRIFRSGVERTANVAQRCIMTFDIELIFDGEWDSVKGATNLFGGLKFSIELFGLLQGVIEDDFGEGVRLRAWSQDQRCSLCAY